MTNPQLPSDDAVASAVVALLAEHAQVDGAALHAEVRADELGLSTLELELVLFEIEDRFDIDLPRQPAGAASWTIGELVQQVLAAGRPPLVQAD